MPLNKAFILVKFMFLTSAKIKTNPT